MDIKKRYILKICLSVCVLSLLQVNGLSVIKANWSPIAFAGFQAESPGTSINQYVVEGASYFLLSHSSILNFLYQVEISEINGTDYSQLLEDIDAAITHMEDARLIYTELTQLAESTPYNPQVIEKLESFDYNKFCRDNGINCLIFRDVKDYLKKGDVRGLYQKMLLDTEEILDILYEINTDISAATMPEIGLIWDLNHRCFLSLIFDQYASMVFYEILNEME